MLPTEHVHFAGAPDGHTSGVVHRHAESHHTAGTQTAVDHPDEDIDWLESAFIRPVSVSGAVPVLSRLSDPAPLAPPNAVQGTVVQIVRVRVHDPPWIATAGLRAPPTLSA